MTDGDIATNVRVASSRFEAVGALTESVQRWDLHFTQLDRGRFDGRVFLLQWNGIQVQRAWGQFAADYRRHFGKLPSATLHGD